MFARDYDGTIDVSTPNPKFDLDRFFGLTDDKRQRAEVRPMCDERQHTEVNDILIRQPAQKVLRFSSEGMFGDQIELHIESDHHVRVSCYYAPPPNDRFGGGGHDRMMPEELVRNYDHTRFIEWLKSSFWGGLIIRPVDEARVKQFLHDAELAFWSN